jgi:hypothetical protein
VTRLAAVLLLVLGSASCALEERIEGLPSYDPSRPPACQVDGSWPLNVLLMQSVPEAAWVPCVRDVPAGWIYVGTEVGRDAASMSFSADGTYRLEVRFEPTCDAAGARPSNRTTPGSEAAGPIRLLVRRPGAEPGFAYEEIAVFSGGCVRQLFTAEPSGIGIVGEATRIVGYFDRVTAAADIEASYGVRICGVGVSACAG